MKPNIAIVQTQSDLAAQQVIVWRTEERDAETSAARWEQQAGAARATAKARRLQIGELCAKQREKWPLSGPRARGWGEWLAKARLDDSTAWRYMDAWKSRNKRGDDVGDPSQSSDVRGNDERDGKTDDMPSVESIAAHQADPELPPALSEQQLLDQLAQLAPEAQLRIRKAIKVTNANGGSGEKPRGAWCTPEKWARAVGPWDLDPFSNPRSQIEAAARCMLEDGGDGLANPMLPGTFRAGADGSPRVAGPDMRVWLQPPYESGFVERVIAHYGHTRFCALLRWSPDTGWFEQLWPLVKVVAFPIGERLDFDPPPGVPESSTPHAHAFHYSDPRDVTEEIARRCIVLTRHEALRLVR